LVQSLRHPAQPATSELARRVFHEGQELLGGPGDEAMLAELFPRPEDLKLIRLLGIHSWAVVPLAARGRIHGALTFLSSAPDRTYGEYELGLARGLAARAAIALDNGQLLAEAQAATHAREQLLSIVAHDLRSPLQSVRMAAELLLRRLEAGEVPDVAPVQAIGRAAVRMDRLIADLLDWARIGAGSLSVVPRPLEVEPLLEEVMETIRPQAGAHRLRARTAPGLPRFLGDRERLVQVLINLLSNALKFTPPGGAIALSAESGPQGGVTFSVTDSGPGISAEQRAQIFEPFWQREPGDRRGIGLGLTISKGLVRAHGAQLEISSWPGRGTRFSFTLPAA
jgi:signal transduction histidine kinase